MKISKKLLTIMILILLLLSAASFYMSFKLITQFPEFTFQGVVTFVLAGLCLIGGLGACIYLGGVK